MKYHKIRGVPMEVCTAEQKIAYNLAFRLHISHGDKYKFIAKNYSKIVLSNVENQLIDEAFRLWENDGTERYDIDAIFSALRAGLNDYLLHHFIAADYERIGKAFPAHYL